MIRTIKISELQSMGVETCSVKDNSVRGYTTKATREVCIGDKVIVNNYFTEVTEG